MLNELCKQNFFYNINLMDFTAKIEAKHIMLSD